MKKRPRDLSSPSPDIRNEKKSNTEKDCGRSGMSSTRIGKSFMDIPDDFFDLVSPRSAFQKKLKLSQENKENLDQITDQGENEGNSKVKHFIKNKRRSTADSDSINSLMHTFILLVIYL
jgi:myb proto-oncogene protein